MMQKTSCLIIGKKEVAENTFVIDLKFDKPHGMKAGQFLMCFVPNRFSGIPIALYQLHNSKSFSILVKAVGEGTIKLCQFQLNDNLQVLLPLSENLKKLNYKNIYLIGGGVGIAPIFEIAKLYSEQKYNVKVILAFKSKNDICELDTFKKSFKNTILCCDESSKGAYKGNVIEFLNTQKIDYSNSYFYVCGSHSLSKAMDLFLQKQNCQGSLLLENQMACGFGVCNSCNVILKNGNVKKVCENYAFNVGEIKYE